MIASFAAPYHDVHTFLGAYRFEHFSFGLILNFACAQLSDSST